MKKTTPFLTFSKLAKRSISRRSGSLVWRSNPRKHGGDTFAEVLVCTCLNMEGNFAGGKKAREWIPVFLEEGFVAQAVQSSTKIRAFKRNV